MIDRYTRPQMGALWTDEAKFSVWLEIEILATEAQAELGVVPLDAARTVRQKAKFEVERTLAIEAETHHDVIAFLTNVAEHVGPDSRFIHLGMTSSDVVDTGLSVQMRRAGLMLRDGLVALREALGRRAREFKHTPRIGRSHGIHAEPTTFGLTLAVWYDEARRNLERLDRAIETISVGQISGAVGTFAHLDPAVEAHVCQALDLAPAPVSTQIIQRDRHAEFLTTLAVIAASIEKIATEIRHLQRTEVLEAEESFAPGQKGSSAMPHKRNPIISERLCGMARLLRGNALASLENVALWHERDISHSSVERVIVPDSCIALDYMLAKATWLIDKLVVYPERMMENLGRTHGLIFSQKVLLALAKAGMSREDAYSVVQRHAMQTWADGVPLLGRLKTDPTVTEHLPADQLDDLFDLQSELRHVDTIFARVGLG